MAIFPVLYSIFIYIYGHTHQFVPLNPLSLFYSSSIPPPPLVTSSFFSISVGMFLFCYIHLFVFIFVFRFYLKMITGYVFLWLISLTIIPFWSIHAVAKGKFSFIFYGWLISQCVCVCVCVWVHIFFIHSSVKGHLGGFHVLTIVNNAAMKIGMHASFQINVFVFLRYHSIAFRFLCFSKMSEVNLNIALLEHCAFFFLFIFKLLYVNIPYVSFGQLHLLCPRMVL